jgi:DNA-binding NarL/FixJ family response regulator
MMKPVRVILADDHTIVRKGLRVLLDEAGYMDVVAEAQNGYEVLDLVDKHRPDVVVMDISMPHLNGLEATRRVKANYPGTKVVILTMHLAEEYIVQSLRAGAHGYLVKQSAPKELVHAIDRAVADELYISAEIGDYDIDELILRSQSEVDPDRYASLTKREREVLQLIAEGNEVGQIAMMLFISEKTVRAHRGHLMDKLDLHNPAALTLYALQKGIITLD